MPKTPPKGSTIQVRVGDSMKQSIARYARAREMTNGEFVRYCIWTYMDSTPPDEAEEFEHPNPDASQSVERNVEIGEVRRG